MIVFENDRSVFFDVDQTLILWNPPEGEKTIEILDPYDGKLEVLAPMHRHIKILIRAKSRGNKIIVWSHGGTLWAQAVVEALGLTKYVDLIMTKVENYVDDIPMNKWATINYYIKGHYGQPIAQSED